MKAFNTGIFGLWEEKKRKEKIKEIGGGVGPTKRHMLLSVLCSSVTWNRSFWKFLKLGVCLNIIYFVEIEKLLLKLS